MSYIKKTKKNGKVYLSEVESKRINGKVVTKHIRYIGKEVDGKTILSSSVSNVEIEQVKVYGPLLILNHIAQEIKLSSLLGEYGDEILSMVYAHCLNYESLNRMPEWFSRTDLNMLLDLEDLTEHRLLMALDSLEEKDSMHLQQKIFEIVAKKHNVNKTGIVYDVTNTYFCGKKCELGRCGKDKEGITGRPLIQIGLGVTQEKGIPVFHKTFHGNIHDSKTFQDMIISFCEYKISNGVIVFDRGISSKQNQVNIKELKWKVLCGLPIGKELKRILLNLLKTTNFTKLKNRVKLNKTIFYVEVVPHTIAGVKGKLAFCFNDKKSQQLRESRYDEIEYAKKLISDGKEIKDGIKKFFSADGNLLMKKVKEEEELDGYSKVDPICWTVIALI
jgi:transposase